MQLGTNFRDQVLSIAPGSKSIRSLTESLKRWESKERRGSVTPSERRAMAITKREQEQIEKANASGKTPAVFIHGLWLLPSSWDRWAAVFEEAGYAGLTPVWPDDPLTVEEARANPDVLAKKTIRQVADHTAEVIGQLQKKPAVLGHSTGGLLAQIIAGRGLSAVTVAIDPGPFRGVLPLPFSTLKVSAPVLSNPLNRGRAVTLTFDQFKYGWTNALGDEEAKGSTRPTTWRRREWR